MDSMPEAASVAAAVLEAVAVDGVTMAMLEVRKERQQRARGTIKSDVTRRLACIVTPSSP